MSGQREYVHMEAGVRDLLRQTGTVPNLIIRDADPEDSQTLGELYAQAYFELMDQLPPPRSETLEDFTTMMIESFTKTSKQKQRKAFGVAWNIFKWIAEYFGCPVGFLVTGVTEDRGYIGEIGVLPSYRRRGIAQALLHRFASFLKDSDIQMVELDVNVDNSPAIGLYQSCGFKKTHTWCSDNK